MTETKKTIPKAGGEKSAAKKTSGAGRKTSAPDAYDAFLEEAERAEKEQAKGTRSRGETSHKGTAGKPAARKRTPKPSAAKKPSGGKETTASGSAAAGKRASSGKAAKTEYQSDLLAAWDELERESRLRRDARRSNGSAAPQWRTASGAAAARQSSANGTARRRPPQSPASRRPADGRRSDRNGARASKARARQAVLLVENGRDPYDDFLDAADRRPARKRSKGIGALTVLLAAAIVCILGLGGWQYAQYQRFLTMKAAVDRQTFYDGTAVEGIDVSAMTLEQAKAYWAEQIEPQYARRTVTLSNGAAFTAAELGYSSDYETVLGNAWSAGRSGSLEERYAALSEREGQTVSYAVTRSAYSAEVVRQCVSAIAAQIDRPAENAKIGSFDAESYTFQFSDEVTGSRLDQTRLAADMAAALDAGGGEVELVVRAIQPEVKKEDMASQYGMIASAVTNASSSSANRLSNIRLALQFINGTCLKPGETFSFNGVVGERTTARGFKSATAYSSGKVIEEVGGGICQVSTTLFNAAVKADLEIVERHNHSLTVGYVDLGKDAAVNWGNQDLRFTNNSSDSVYICCYLTSDKRVRFGIFGRLLPNGESITVEGVTTGKIDFETVYQANPSMASGQTQVVQNGKQGYTAEAYKIRWDANGNQIGRELLCKSTYRATSQIIEYGP